MNDAERADFLHQLATLELEGIEQLMTSHERLHDLLNEVWEQFGLPQYSYEEPGVLTTTFVNQIREQLIALESE